MNKNIDNMCRLCLESGDEMQDIYSPTNNYVDVVEELTGLKIAQEFNFPSAVCSNCIANINTVNSFKRKCLDSDKALRDDLVVITAIIVEYDDDRLSEEHFEEPLKDTEVKHDHGEGDQFRSLNNKPSKKIPPNFDEGEPSSVEEDQCPGIARKKCKSTMTPCYICGKLYYKQALKYHLNKHAGDRPFVCEVQDCGKTFPAPSLLASHNKMCHTNNFRFACDICGHMFKVKTTFDIHRSYHFEPELPCSVCGKLMRHKRALKKHMMSHTGERPFPCNKCSKSFQTKYSLRIHQRVHTKERPFTCTICKKSFSYSCVLKTHMAKHTPVIERESC